jgi:hypothetical protein
MNTINDVIDIVTENDPKFDHSAEVKPAVCDISCYRDMLREEVLHARKPALDAFFKTKSDNYPQNEPKSDSSSSM